MSWRTTVRKRFDARAILSREEIKIEYGVASEGEFDLVYEALSIFQEEFGIVPGRLRSSDPLETFTAWPETRSPLTWLTNRAAYEDALSEIALHLAIRQQAGKGLGDNGLPASIGDYVRRYVLPSGEEKSV